MKDRLEFDGSELSCWWGSDVGTSEVQWRFDVAGLKCIGEYTTAADPVVTDYFVNFLTGAKRYQASAYAEGRDEVLDALARYLGAPLVLHLGAETAFESRILWPPQVQGHPVFVPRREITPSFLRRLWTRTPVGRAYEVNPIISELLSETASGKNTGGGSR